MGMPRTAVLLVGVLALVSTAVTLTDEVPAARACPARHVCLWSGANYTGYRTVLSGAELSACVSLPVQFRSVRNKAALAVLVYPSADCSGATSPFVVLYSGSVPAVTESRSLGVTPCREQRQYSPLPCGGGTG